MRREALWAAMIGIVALIWVAPYHGGRQDTGVSVVGDPPVGTAGREEANQQDESPATLHDLETVTGTVDPHELIGTRVDFHVKVADINNYTSFWIANQDNRMLVVLGRAPSPNDIKPAAPGQMVRITGTIEGIPSNDRLQDQTVYIRAEHVTPEG
jgi:hypothetical protein